MKSFNNFISSNEGIRWYSKGKFTKDDEWVNPEPINTEPVIFKKGDKVRLKDDCDAVFYTGGELHVPGVWKENFRFKRNVKSVFKAGYSHTDPILMFVDYGKWYKAENFEKVE